MSFEKQQINLNTNDWSVELKYFAYSSISAEELTSIKPDVIIQLSEENTYSSNLLIKLIEEGDNKTCLVKEIHGSGYLHASQENDTSQSVKIEGDQLILSLGVHFFSIDLTTLSLNWELQPDMAEIFEFYDLQGDFLLRGEVEIHRINKSGNVKWSYGGKDIWVNMEGKPEVTIEEDHIRLLDFNSDEYLIDFNGRTITKQK